MDWGIIVPFWISAATSELCCNNRVHTKVATFVSASPGKEGEEGREKPVWKSKGCSGASGTSAGAMWVRATAGHSYSQCKFLGISARDSIVSAFWCVLICFVFWFWRFCFVVLCCVVLCFGWFELIFCLCFWRHIREILIRQKNPSSGVFLLRRILRRISNLWEETKAFCTVELDFTSGDSGEPGQMGFSLCLQNGYAALEGNCEEKS